MRFRETLDPRRHQVAPWPHPMFEELLRLPIIAQGQDSDLRLEMQRSSRLRYWTSRLTVQDRPQTESGHYEGAYPRIFVEAEVDGEWVLVDGYQGHMT